MDSSGKIKLLTTYGMAAIEMRGTNGELLQLAPGGGRLCSENGLAKQQQRGRKKFIDLHSVSQRLFATWECPSVMLLISIRKVSSVTHTSANKFLTML